MLIKLRNTVMFLIVLLAIARFISNVNAEPYGAKSQYQQEKDRYSNSRSTDSKYNRESTVTGREFSRSPTGAPPKYVVETDGYDNKMYHKKRYVIEGNRMIEVDSVGNKLYHKPQKIIE